MEIFVETRSQTRKENLTNLAKLFAHKLKITNSRFRLTVITDEVVKNADARGTVIQMGERDLVMILDRNLRTVQLVQTMAHEMIHVKQFCRGQLTQHVDRRGNLYYKWMGKKAKSQDYYDRPWELDAFRNERILANQVFRLAD